MNELSTNPFDVSTRAVGIFDTLESDLKAKSSNILTSLSQFFRLVLIEGNVGWYKEVNRYDLLVKIKVHNKTNVLETLNNTIKVVPHISPIQKYCKDVSIEEFTNTVIIIVDGSKFTIQDFVLSIAYHGSIHMKATKELRLADLYNDFIIPNNHKSLMLCTEIGNQLISAFQEVRKKFSGDNNAYCTVNDKSPKIVKSGQIVKFKNGEIAQEFINSYLQIPIRKQTNIGLRICLDLQIIKDKVKGTIFSYGHRQNDGLKVLLKYNNSVILASVYNGNKSETIRILKIKKFFRGRHILEICIYPDGTFILAMDEKRLETFKLKDEFSISNGKLMIGSDLNGKNSGSFLCSIFSIEGIADTGQITNIFRSGLKRLIETEGNKILKSDIDRPAIR